MLILWQWRWMHGVWKNHDFQVTSHLIVEMIQDRAIVTMECCGYETKPNLSNGTIFNDSERPPKPDFKVTALFDTEYLRNGTRYRHSYNRIFRDTRPTQGCHFKWLSDLAKNLMTRSIVRFFFDSWASGSNSCVRKQKVGVFSEHTVVLRSIPMRFIR